MISSRNLKSDPAAGQVNSVSWTIHFCLTEGVEVRPSARHPPPERSSASTFKHIASTISGFVNSRRNEYRATPDADADIVHAMCVQTTGVSGPGTLPASPRRRANSSRQRPSTILGALSR